MWSFSEHFENFNRNLSSYLKFSVLKNKEKAEKNPTSFSDIL